MTADDNGSWYLDETVRSEILGLEYSPEDELASCGSKLRTIADEHGLLFVTNATVAGADIDARHIVEEGQRLVRKYLIPNPEAELPYETGEVWGGYYHRGEKTMHAWVEGNPRYDEKLGHFIYDEEFPWRETDIFSRPALDEILAAFGGRGARHMGYRNVRVVETYLRRGPLAILLSRWLNAALFVSGSQAIVTRAVIYTDGRSPPLRSLLLDGFIPFGFKELVYRDILPNNGAIYLIKYVAPTDILAFFERNRELIRQLMTVPAMKTALASIRTSFRS